MLKAGEFNLPLCTDDAADNTRSLTVAHSSSSSTHISQVSIKLSDDNNDNMPDASQDNQKAENIVSKAKRSKKRQRCAEEEIMLRDFGPERQSGRLRILKEYPPEPPTPVKAAAAQATTPLNTASERKSKKKREQQPKSPVKRQRKKDVEVRAAEDKAVMEKKALRKAKGKKKRNVTREEMGILDAKGGSKVLKEDCKSLDPSRSRSYAKRNKRNKRRKEVRPATVSAPDLIVDAPSPDIGDEIVAIQASTSRRIDGPPHDIGEEMVAIRASTLHRIEGPPHDVGEEIVAIQAGSYASLESMFHEAPFASTTHSASEIIIKTRRGARLTPRQTGTKSDRQIGSRRIEYSHMSVTKKAGIKSSTFARVMRLVADLPPVQVADVPLKRQHAARRPPVWADVSLRKWTLPTRLMFYQSRQELCEALPYYRAFQSGLYMHQKVAFGYLLDGFPAP